ncbi:YigZ family protein [Imbroritus primus]|jgi:uncharacterized YigZ family protein|uniref:YigZ family protein n=1 Tax=Imbroritus primus TaxID=3058603 RepID=A0ACD3SVL5_9BURK|nr:YigZ family protein [Burkholderiaceae bacterium PBA]
MPLTLAAPAHSDLQIRKSRFIGCVEPVAGRVAALQRVSALRAAHPGAAHVCWALMAGGESAAVDDGEPSGTAGRPMLDVLRHHDLEGVLATVVRYFGGVKLGAGGLVRAYTDTVAQALLEADKVLLVRKRTVGCSVPYAFEGVLRRSLEAAGAELLRVAHGGVVEFEFALPEGDVADFMHRMTEASHGQLSWDRDAGADEASGHR